MHILITYTENYTPLIRHDLSIIIVIIEFLKDIKVKSRLFFTVEIQISCMMVNEISILLDILDKTRNLWI